MTTAKSQRPERPSAACCRVIALAGAVLMSLVFAVPSMASDTRVFGKSYGPGEYRIAGQALSCRQVRTLVSTQLNDYGAAVPGTIVLNPERLSRLPVATRLFVYAHECGHQIHGRSEAAADCYAAQRGREEGWLTRQTISGICNVFPKTGGTKTHAARGARCTVIQACFSGEAVPSQMAGSTSYEAAARGFIGR